LPFSAGRGRKIKDEQGVEIRSKRHCEERSDAAIQKKFHFLQEKMVKKESLDCFVGLRPSRNDKETNLLF
jgi:hypothetical protein